MSTPAASTCLPLRLSSRMLTHGNPTGIEDHQTTCDWRSGRGVQAASYFFFLLGDLLFGVLYAFRALARLRRVRENRKRDRSQARSERLNHHTQGHGEAERREEKRCRERVSVTSRLGQEVSGTWGSMGEPSYGEVLGTSDRDPKPVPILSRGR